MEYTFRVVTKKMYLPMQYRLNEAFRWFEEHQSEVKIDATTHFDEVIFTLHLLIRRSTTYLDFQTMRDIFIHHLAECLAEHIVKDWEDHLIKEKIDACAITLDALEKAYVFRATKDFLHLSNEEEKIQELVNYSRKIKIWALIEECLCSHYEFHTFGFIRFYLKEFKKEIDYTTLYILNKFERKEAHELLSGVLKLLYISRYLN